jgi:opacity protein-like surface antigen
MRKISVLALIFCLVSTKSLMAQDDDLAFGGQGTTVINAGYGIGSVWKNLFKISAGFTGAKVTSLGPVAAGFEIGVTDHIGVGLQVGYGEVKSVSTDPGNNSNGGDLITTEKLTSLQIMARGNYHFGQSSKFDPYLGLGLGYGNFKYSYSDNDPNYPGTGTFAIPSAFVYTGALGARYYFASSFGIYAEVGYVTGSYLQVGIVVRP